MALPTGYRLRAPVPADLEAVGAVLAADELVDAGEVTLGTDYVAGQWAQSDLELASDAWLVHDGSGVVVGYAQVRRDEPAAIGSWGVVHPGHRGRGIGSVLLDRIEERAAEIAGGDPAVRLTHSVNAGDDAVAAMLRARGFRPVHHFWHMGIDLDQAVEPGPVPAGIEIGGIAAPVDLAAVHAVLVGAFGDDLTHRPESFETWLEEETRGPRYDPTLWLVARDAERMVGVLTASVAPSRDDRGWVDYLGVLPGWRGRGIGTGLLGRCFAAFQGGGVQRVLLNVDARNPTGATALYERVGMTIAKRWDRWER